jgi:hypothetical protein
MILNNSRLAITSWICSIWRRFFLSSLTDNTFIGFDNDAVIGAMVHNATFNNIKVCKLNKRSRRSNKKDNQSRDTSNIEHNTHRPKTNNANNMTQKAENMSVTDSTENR